MSSQSQETNLPKGWCVAKCEICNKQWKTQKSLATRTCSRKCGARINPFSSRDDSKWTMVECFECKKLFKKRKIHIRSKRFFCSRECLSSGFAKLHKTHDVKSNQALGIKRGYYKTRDDRSVKYDSSYELRRMREYDYLMNDELESWERCVLAIPYTDGQGKVRHYNPDFLLRYVDGHIVIEEVKGKMTDDDVLKFEALISYCEKLENVEARMFSHPDFQQRLEVKTKVYENDYGSFSRPVLEYVFMSMAMSLAERSTCLRKKVGVVFTDPLMQQAYCLGYNGDEIGGKNQCESLKPGACNCVHAEINALTKNNFDITGCTCFITLAPCPVCAKVLINRRVKRVVYLESYRNNRGIQLLNKRGIETIKYDKLLTATYV